MFTTDRSKNSNHKSRRQFLKALAHTAVATVGGTMLASPTFADSKFGRAPLNVPKSNLPVGRNDRLTKIEDPKPSFVLGPAACSSGLNRLDVFALGSTQQMGMGLWQKTHNGQSWSSWQFVGKTSGPPAACTLAPGRIDVFSQGEKQRLYQKTLSGGSWSGWKDLGGFLGSAPPAAAARGSARIDLLARFEGSPYKLAMRTTDGSTWTAWQDLDPPNGPIYTPAAIGLSPTSTRIVVQDQNKHLWMRTSNGSKWSTWEDLGGSIASDPADGHTGVAVCRTAANLQDRFHVVALGGNGQLIYKHQNMNTNAWSDWQDLGGTFGHFPACVARGNKTVEVFGVGNDGKVWWRSIGAGSNNWKQL